MLHVLVVDDEPFIRQGIRLLIDWEEEGCKIIGEASNGREALACIEQESVDLVIADIKMPEMNGLELLTHLREVRKSNVYFVILSGFSDFEYAQKAIHYRCMDYMLKPVNKEELLKIIRKVSLQSEKAVEESKKREKGEKAIFDRNIISLLCGNTDHVNLQAILDFASFGSGNLQYVTIEVELDDDAMVEWEKREIQRQMYEECRKRLGKKADTHIIYDAVKEESCYDVGLIYEKNLDDLIDLKGAISAVIPYPIRMYVGRSVKGIHKISESYKDTSVMRAMQLFKSDKNITYYEHEISHVEGKSIDKHSLDALVHAIEENNKEKIDQNVKKFFEHVFYYSMDARIINLNIDYILYRLLHIAMSLDDKLNQEEVLKYISLEVFEKKGFEKSEVQFQEFAYSFADYLSQLRSSVPKGVLAEIEEEIRRTYMGNISLKSLSEKYFINSAYLGQLFKKQFGKSFKDYLSEYRIDRAAEMLLRTDDKVYTIAEKVGYQNYEYFVNKFVSLKGCTPTKYRKRK